MKPTPSEIQASHQHVLEWFAKSAPLVEWAAMDSPLGTVYLARNVAGLCSLDFGTDESTFVEHLNPLARTERDTDALAPVIRQLEQYFAGKRHKFNVPVDLSQMTEFQQDVLDTAQTIPSGKVWTYGQVAQHIGKPRASRAVGQALGSNPIPIIVPCHRVIGSNGQMTGYSGGGGIEDKKWLLRLEGAL